MHLSFKGGCQLHLKQVFVRLVGRDEDPRFEHLMQRHHYLGALPKIGETLRYAACVGDQWVGLIIFSAAALKCAARDRWIGWHFRHQFDRLNLLTNNSRFLILPDWHLPNLASRILALCRKRLPADWQAAFGHPVLLLETFVDPVRFQGTVYKADNWTAVGCSKGFHRQAKGYSDSAESPKMVFVKPLRPDAQSLLSRPVLPPLYQTGGSKIMLPAQYMHSLPRFFADIPDPRRPQGRRHRLDTVLAIAADALLTQRKFAEYIVEQRHAHYHFTVKNNQPGLFKDIGLFFKDRGQPDFVLFDPPDHGRIEERKIWTTTELNDFLDFPHVKQAFVIERRCIDKKSGEQSCDIALGITSRPVEQADAERLLTVNRGHWCIENKCHYIIDWNFDEDRSRIRKGNGPENITRLRRFAVGVIISKGVRSVAQKMRQLTRNVRLVFDYLAMTDNCRPAATRP